VDNPAPGIHPSPICRSSSTAYTRACRGAQCSAASALRSARPPDEVPMQSYEARPFCLILANYEGDTRRERSVNRVARVNFANRIGGNSKVRKQAQPAAVALPNPPCSVVHDGDFVRYYILERLRQRSTGGMRRVLLRCVMTRSSC
jgi:hypothetical protein